MKFLRHSILLILSFGFVFLWAQSPLTSYTIQALGLLVATYLITSFVRRKKNKQAEFGADSDIFILNTAILLLVTITGNLYSPLFFLLYFLGFGITFIFEPASVFIFTIGTVLIFLPEALKNASIESFLRLGSVILISPLAFFFGQEYKDRDIQEETITAMQEREKDAADTIAKDITQVIHDEKDLLKPEDVEKLNEILEQAADLRAESSK